MLAARASALIASAAAVGVCGAAAQVAVPPEREPVFQGFVWEGGTADDRSFAEMASGLVKGALRKELQFDRALEAIRATDRFKSVEGSLGADGTARIRLQPWAPLQSWNWQGDALPKKTKSLLLPDLKKGMRLGDLRLEEWRRLSESRLRDEGYPQARLAAGRDASGERLVLKLELGPPSLVKSVSVDGDLGPYRLETLLDVARIQVGRTLWTQDLRRQAARRIRRRFVKDKRLEGQAGLSFSSDGALALSVAPGPVVRLSSEGKWLSQRTLRELLPLARTDRYGPELLDEGDRRLIRHFRDKGFLDVQCTHVREVVSGTAAQPQEVRIAYRIQTSDRRYIQSILFEGNQELNDKDLRRVAKLPMGLLYFNAPRATPDLLSEIETRITNRYLLLGYSDVKLRRRMEIRNGEQILILTIREGPRRTVRSIILELPEGPSWDPWTFGETMLRAVADKPALLSPAFSQRRRYRSDRRELGGLVAILEILPSELGKPRKAVRLLTERPVPYVRADLGAVLGELNQSVAALGSPKPIVRFHSDEDDAGATIHIEIPAQTLTFVARRVVQGSLETSSKAIARETQDLEPGDPLNLERVGRAQANLGNLGAFKRVDVVSMKEAAEASAAAAPETPWGESDLVLRLEERSHWVFSESFGYDKSTGYNFGYGVQRLNFQGMGRTLDFGLRAGDGTINNAALRRLFPTGDFSRSVDSYTLGYTDPWFLPGILAGILPERVQYRAEASYIQEQQTAYLIRRRRVLNGLEWRPDATHVLRAGHRFERSDVRLVDLVDLNTPQYQLFKPILEDPQLLNKATRSPSSSTISAPYFQWIHDTRDSPYDPTAGAITSLRLDLANQLFGTSRNSSFVKLDARQQWTWPVGYRASAGVVSLGLRIGAARPTASTSQELPLAERFFAGGPGTFRGAEPDRLGPTGGIPYLRQTSDGKYAPQLTSDGKSILYQLIPIGGQGLALVNLEYRFPVIGNTIWGEVFMDAGQVYQSLRHDPDSLNPSFPPLRVAFGLGLIIKLGLPIKIEYGSDVNRILGRPRSQLDKESQLHSLLISAGYQF
ncbi:MAG: BamA/TamA family outer membrane protein [Holophagaceae bacterium]|nr:BamA/TamA family outer membrane protein [Holophagaceae bacterium]